MVKDLAAAGKSMAEAIEKEGFEISTKSVIIPDTEAAKEVRHILQQAGFQLQLAATARDLGIDAGAGLRRNRTVLKKRLWQGKQRNQRVRTLAKAFPAARRLLATGVLPKSTWGHQSQGLLSREIRQLRVRAMRAMDTKTTGRCVTTMLAFGLS